MMLKRNLGRIIIIFIILTSLVWAKEHPRTQRALVISYTSITSMEAHGFIAVLPQAKVDKKNLDCSEYATFSLPSTSLEQKTFLEIFTMMGQRIFWKESQNHELYWEGKNQYNRPVPFGIYPFILRVATGDHKATNTSHSRLFEDVTESALPVDSSRAGDCEIGDIDGDGDLDIVLAHWADYGRQVQIYINNGLGNFSDDTASRMPTVLTITQDLDLVDIDNDDDLDIYLANTAADDFGEPVGLDNLLINDGSGHFKDELRSRVPQTWVATQNVAFGDVDNDNDADLLVTHMTNLTIEDSSQVRLLFNDGNGFFTESSPLHLNSCGYLAYDLVIVDINNDDYLDLVFANLPIVFMDITGNTTGSLSGQNTIFINNGQGYFTNETTSRLPQPIEDNTVEIAAGDVDQDGDMDLYFNNTGFSPDEATNRLLINNGDGFFTDETSTRLPAETILWNNDAEMADYDGDGMIDIFLASVHPMIGGNALDILYLNNNSGHFKDCSSDLPQVEDFSVAAIAGDVNFDNRVDLYIANNIPVVSDTIPAQNRLYLNTGLSSAVFNSNSDGPITTFKLNPCHPNPFNSSTLISYNIPEESFVTLEIYNISGQKVRTLSSQKYIPGSYNLKWDGRDELNQLLGSGVYICRMHAGEILHTAKIVLLK